jgi:hypothetical protein
MPKVNRNHQEASAPMRVLINKQSEKVLKDTFNDDIPQTLKYTLDDFRLLYDMFMGEYKEEHPSDVDLLKIYLYIQSTCSWRHATNTAVFFQFHKLRKETILKRVYDMVFKEKLEDIPLKINHPHHFIIAKWRLLINK